MGRGAEAVNAETRQLAAERLAGMLERAVADQSGAEQRRRLGVAIGGRQLEAVARVGDGVFGIAAVDLVAGEERVVAQILLAAAAIEAGAVGMSEPRHADAVVDGEAGDAGAKRRHVTHDLMTENERQLGLRQLAVEDVEIGAAHPASGDLDEDLLGSRLGNGQLGKSERLARPVEQHGLHDRRDGHVLPSLGAASAAVRNVYPVLPMSRQAMVVPKLSRAMVCCRSGGSRPAIAPATKQ